MAVVPAVQPSGNLRKIPVHLGLSTGIGMSIGLPPPGASELISHLSDMHLREGLQFSPSKARPSLRQGQPCPSPDSRPPHHPLGTVQGVVRDHARGGQRPEVSDFPHYAKMGLNER